MRRDTAVAAGFGLAVLALLAATTPADRGENRRAMNATYNVTSDGTRYTVHPSELVMGCSGKDCIPSIDDPSFVAAEDADWLGDGDLVLGLEIEGEARAYPLRVLNLHEIVNDRVGGDPVAVTYCPLCRSALVYSRTVEGQTLEFGVSGRLLNANLVMYDRETGTFWSQIQGDALVGPLVPAELDLVTSTLTGWEDWRAAHPDTRVLSRDTGIYPPDAYGRDPYAGYANSSRVGFGVDATDDRLTPKRIVYGVAVGDAAVAYTEDAIRTEGAINDEVGGLPVVLVADPVDGGIDVFVRTAGNATLAFERSGDGLVDGNGDRWSHDGVAREGPHEGTRLDRLNSHGFFWFAWSAFHPGTDVYGGGES